MTQTTLFSSHETPALVVPHRFMRTCKDWPESVTVARSEFRSRRWSEVLIGPGQPDEPHRVMLS